MQEIIKKVKSITEFTRRSTVATAKLREMQQQMGQPQLILKQDVATRWNSTYYMLKRITEVKEPLISTLALINPQLQVLSQADWEIIKEACDVLQPFEEVTVELSAEKTNDPLEWWRSRATVFKNACDVMKTRLCVVATSVPSERIFSKTGQILTDRRNRLTSRKVQQLVFLNANL
uniref:HAT C-terminal dimerisation domain-containing protein n=1 Tax=Knipowitschia caucasica TaxID=637954 RepID=A0AAV2L4T4_KNICA